MVVTILAQQLNTTPQEVERLLALPAAEVYDDPVYLEFVSHLHADTLQATSRAVRDIYETALEPLKEQHGLGGTVMSGYTLVNWVLGFLSYPDTMRDMLERHANLPVDLIAEVLPELIELVGEANVEWQHALAVFSLPLLARR